MDKEIKARKLVLEDKVFKRNETDKYAYYICKGSNKDIHDIIHHKEEDTWSCSCKNMRLIDCSHIVACKMLELESDL